MFSTKMAVGVHILSVIALDEGKVLTSEQIADSIQTNPALVRRLMAQLKKAGLIETKTKVGVIKLVRPLEQITLWDVFEAVEPKQDLFDIHHDTNPSCPVGAHIEQALKQTRQSLNEDFKQSLKHQNIQNIYQTMMKEN